MASEPIPKWYYALLILPVAAIAAFVVPNQPETLPKPEHQQIVEKPTSNLITSIEPLPLKDRKFVIPPKLLETLPKEIQAASDEFPSRFRFRQKEMLSNDMPGTMHNFWIHFETDLIRSNDECMPAVQSAIKRAVHTKYVDLVRVYFYIPGQGIPYLQIDWERPYETADYSNYRFKVDDRRSMIAELEESKNKPDDTAGESDEEEDDQPTKKASAKPATVKSRKPASPTALRPIPSKHPRYPSK